MARDSWIVEKHTTFALKHRIKIVKEPEKSQVVCDAKTLSRIVLMPNEASAIFRSSDRIQIDISVGTDGPMAARAVYH
jgi:hypothetical protein